MAINPSGLCECGCGESTRIMMENDAAQGRVKGEHYRFIRFHQNRMQKAPLAERFWAKVDQSGECWLWTAAVDPNGYGRFGVTSADVRTSHRVAWELVNGPIPKGEGYHGTCVLHRCDTPACVRPDHLFLGTQADNLRDMAAKGRHGRQHRRSA